MRFLFSKEKSMGKYDFDQLCDRRNSCSYKWNIKDNELPMFVADMDFHSLPEIKDALRHRVEVDSYGYCFNPEEYFQAYSSWWKRRHNVDIDVNNMTFATSVITGLKSILRHLVHEKSNIVLQLPIYHTFLHVIPDLGHNVVNSPLKYDGKTYEIDYQNLEELLKDARNNVFLLCNPHNPTGRLYSLEELKKISDLCHKYGTLLISDEIHCDIVDPEYEFHSMLEVDNDAITLLSASKVFNIAGLKSACIVCKNKEMHELINKYTMLDDVGSPNYFSPFATIAAFTYGDEWVDELNIYLSRNKEYVREFVKKELPNVKVVHGHGTYLLWIDVSYYTNDSTSFVNDMRDKVGLIVNDGCNFGEGGNGFFRMNVGTSYQNVIDGCNRLKRYIEMIK